MSNAVSEVNSWLFSKSAFADSSLNIQARDKTHPRDIEIPLKELLESENPVLQKFAKSLEKNNQSLSLNHEHFQQSPYAPMTPEKLKEDLKNPHSPAFKKMMAAIFEMVTYLLQREFLLMRLDELFYRRHRYIEFMENRRAMRFAHQLDDDFPMKEPPLYSSPAIIIQVNFDLLRCESYRQASNDCAFLSQFAPPGKEHVVTDSVKRRCKRRNDYIDHLENISNTDPPPDERVADMISEQADLLARNAELSSMIMQNKLLGRVIQTLMKPSEANSHVAANIEEIVQKFEVAEQAFVEVNSRALERAIHESSNPEKFEQDKQQYEGFSKTASQLGFKLARVFDQYYDQMNNVFEKLEKGQGLAVHETEFAQWMQYAPEKEQALMKLRNHLERLANTTVDDVKEYAMELRSIIDEVKNPIDGVSVPNYLAELVEEECGDALRKLEQNMMRVYVSGLRGDRMDDVKNDSVQQRMRFFYHQQNNPKQDEQPVPMEIDEQEPIFVENSLERFRKAKEEALGNVSGEDAKDEDVELVRLEASDLEELEQCMEELMSMRDKHAQSIALQIKQLISTDNPNDTKESLDEMKKLIEKLSNIDEDQRNEITEKIAAVHILSNLVVTPDLPNLANKAN